MSRFRSYNERKLKDWLYYLPDYHEAAYRSGQEEVVDESGGEGDVFGRWIRATVDDDPPNSRASHTVLLEAVEFLKAKRWGLYQRLKPAFFNGVTSRPWLPDVWQSEAEAGSVPDQFAWADYLDAIEFMADYVEARLPQFRRTDESGPGLPLQKLAVPVPSTAQFRRESPRRSTRRKVAEKVNEYRQDLEDPVAIALAASETGYSTKEVRVIMRQQAEGKL